MTDIVDRTLKVWRRSAFEWGHTDCLMSVGDYIAARGGLDIPARFRGRYDDELGAARLLFRHGGVLGFIDMTGIPRTSEAPSRGDVAAWETGDGHTVGGLCTGDGIAARLQRGVVELPCRRVRIVQAWKVP